MTQSAESSELGKNYLLSTLQKYTQSLIRQFISLAVFIVKKIIMKLLKIVSRPGCQWVVDVTSRGRLDFLSEWQTTPLPDPHHYGTLGRSHFYPPPRTLSGYSFDYRQTIYFCSGCGSEHKRGVDTGGQDLITWSVQSTSTTRGLLSSFLDTQGNSTRRGLLLLSLGTQGTSATREWDTQGTSGCTWHLQGVGCSRHCRTACWATQGGQLWCRPGLFCLLVYIGPDCL